MGIAIEVLPIGPVAVATRTWRSRGRRLFTAIVKVTCAIEHDGHMSVIAPSPIASEERHYRKNPVASLTRGSDLALLVPRPEVVVVGSAFAAPGQMLSRTTVRLAVQRDTTMLINKRLEIIGDRRARPGQEPPAPQAFQQLPILYERALGGIASRENPVGVGMGVDADGLLTLPNVALPAQAGVSPAGFGPIPSAWPSRQKKRGSMSWTAANTTADVEVPADFDDAYYQTAPSDQQTQEIRGGDLIAIVNMHPDIPMLRTYLPKGRGVAMAQTSRGERIPLSLRIDTVHIEPDAMRAEIVFRAAVMMNEEHMGDLRLAATIEQPEAPFEFPDLSTVAGLVARASKPGTSPVPALDFSSTAVIGDEPAPEARGFGSTQVIEPEPEPAPAVGRPKVQGGTVPFPPRLPEPARGLGGTMIIEPDAAPTPKATEAPRSKAVEIPISMPKTPRRGRTPPPFERARASTLVIEAEAAPQSLPFERGKRPAHHAAPAPRDGTPWGSPPAPPPPRVDLRREPEDLGKTLPLSATGAFDEDSTFDQEVPILDKPEPRSSSKHAAVRPVDQKADPKPDAPGTASPWREDPEEKVSPKPAAKAPLPQRANLKSDLYKKLKR